MFPKPVFFDPTGKRGRALSAFAWVSGTISLLTLAAFVLTLVVVDRPAQGNVSIAPPRQAGCEGSSCTPAAGVTMRSVDPQLLISAHELAARLRETERTLAQPHPQGAAPDRRLAGAELASRSDRALSIGFYVNDDDNSYPDLKRVLPQLDWFIPSWLSLEGPGMELKTNLDDRALSYIRSAKPDMPILPIIQNAVDGRWNGDGLAKLLADPAARGARINELKIFLETNKFQGLTIDFEEVPPAAQLNLIRFMHELEDAVADRGYTIVLAVPFNDPSWPYRTYADIADFMLLMGYDEHWEEGKPGSIAGQSWFEKMLDQRMQDLDPARTIIAIGGYGYDWVDDGPGRELKLSRCRVVG